MKAVGFREHGGLDKLQVLDVPKPEVGDRDVLVRVRACALNHLDLWVREGLPGLKLAMPHIPGADVAGAVAAVGKDVSYPEVGVRVAVNPGLYCREGEGGRGGRGAATTRRKPGAPPVWGGSRSAEKLRRAKEIGADVLINASEME